MTQVLPYCIRFCSSCTSWPQHVFQNWTPSWPQGVGPNAHWHDIRSFGLNKHLVFWAPCLLVRIAIGVIVYKMPTDILKRWVPEAHCSASASYVLMMSICGFFRMVGFAVPLSLFAEQNHAYWRMAHQYEWLVICANFAEWRWVSCFDRVVLF